jgi:hypothetical protein
VLDSKYLNLYAGLKLRREMKQMKKRDLQEVYIEQNVISLLFDFMRSGLLRFNSSSTGRGVDIFASSFAAVNLV